MTQHTIVLAGASGDLGARILAALVARGAVVRALVRPDAPAGDAARLAALGAEVARIFTPDVVRTAVFGGATVRGWGNR
jgi:uncharacterized protein YbjT (DUF2867 family)